MGAISIAKITLDIIPAVVAISAPGSVQRVFVTFAVRK